MIQRTTLDNGIRVLSERVPGCHSVSLGVWAGNGSRHESAELNGVSHFIEHMLFKGTGRRSARDVALEVDSVGGLLNGFTCREYSCIYVKILAEKLPMAVDLLGDLICNSRFDSDDIEKERRVILQEIAMIEDNPEEAIHDRFFGNFWSGHPLGAPVTGTVETVSALGREQMLGVLRDRYAGDNLCVVAAGNLDHQRLVDMVGLAVMDVERTGHPHRDSLPVITRSIEMVDRPLEQAQICLGVQGLPYNRPERYTSYILNTILGGNMSSRLFQKVREELGLAYSIYSYHYNHSDSGAFVVTAGTASADAPVVTRIILDEMDRLRREMVSPEELKSAADYLKGSVLLALESTDNRMGRLAKNELFLQQIGVSLEQSMAMIDAVTVEQVRNMAEELFVSETLNLLVAGQVSDKDFPDNLLQL